MKDASRTHLHQLSLQRVRKMLSVINCKCPFSGTCLHCVHPENGPEDIIEEIGENSFAKPVPKCHEDVRDILAYREGLISEQEVIARATQAGEKRLVY
jgi:hypothetical protein